MLDALKKPYNLEAIYTAWPDAPRYNGNSREDPTIWLASVKEGCKGRKVPKEFWHRVGMHFMGRRPRERLDQLEAIMQQMTNRKNVWNWKKFKIAVQNLGLFTQRPDQRAKPDTAGRSTPGRRGSWWSLDKGDTSASQDKGKSVSSIVATGGSSSMAIDKAAISKAPAWMVEACQALDFLTCERPRVMSTISAILITIGAVPAHPAIAAGAGGAFLSSHAVQAIGAVAMGVGQALKTVQDGKVKAEGESKSPK